MSKRPIHNSGMSYFYDKNSPAGSYLYTARAEHRTPLTALDQHGIDIHVLTIPAPGADRFEEKAPVKSPLPSQ